MSDRPKSVGGDYQAIRRAAWLSALASGAAAAVICAMMVREYVRTNVNDPLTSARLEQLKEQIKNGKDDQGLRDEIRRLDLDARDKFFEGRRRLETGGWLLAGSLAVCLACIGVAGAISKRRPPPGRGASGGRSSGLASTPSRLGIVVFAVAAGTAGAWLSLASCLNLTLLVPPKVEQESGPSWPRFRGPDGSGLYADANVPLHWDANSGWKKPIPLEGHNSPVIWGSKVFLTGATKDLREAYCFDAVTGAMLWRTPVKGAGPLDSGKPGDTLDAGYAASTGAADGKRFYAIFASGDIAAFDFAGKLVWARNLGIPEEVHGHASSLAVFRDKVIVQYDRLPGSDGNDRSELIAIKGDSGKDAWRTRRPVSASWATPIVVNAAGRDQIICSGNPWVISYNPSDGKEIWRVKCLGEDQAPSPIFAGGLVIAAGPYDGITAIRPDGSGDVTSTHAAWRDPNRKTQIASPVSNGELVFMTDSDGALNCHDVRTGKLLWSLDTEAQFDSSPSIVGDRLYLIGTKGEVIVMKASPVREMLDKGSLGEPCSACPAFAGGRVYVRTKRPPGEKTPGQDYLICIIK